jgi:hypothetical protein
MEMAYLNPAPVGADGPAPSPLAAESLDRLRERIQAAKALAEEIQLNDTIGIFDRLLQRIGTGVPDPRIANYADGIVHLLVEARHRLQEELSKRKFIAIRPDRTTYLDTTSPAELTQRFPTSATEITDACRAFALE